MPERKTLPELLDIMRALRTPDTGCPWDMKQTFATIAPYTIEEAYEVADAIARDDQHALKDELGDLLLQVVYHAEMASEIGAFAFADVVDGIARKMIRRHPHVFADPALRDRFEADGIWSRVKAEERREQGQEPSSVLDGVPLALPALARAQKLQGKAAAVGFDWPDVCSTFAKVEEEVKELGEVIDSDERSSAARAEELGDLLFALVNVARKIGTDAEALLRAANTKFERRFKAIEAELKARGQAPEDATLAEMDAIWDAAKVRERGAGAG